MIEAEVIMRSDVRIRPANRSDEAFVHRTTGRLAAFGPPAWRTPDEIVEAERRTLRAFFIESPTDTALLIAESNSPLGCETIRIEVTDSGIGIAPEELEKIFDEFYQVTGPRQKGGTGLGLSLTRNFVEMHQGRISVRSEVGKGSSFTVDLPRNYSGEKAAQLHSSTAV